jgi:hypothetical protein
MARNLLLLSLLPAAFAHFLLLSPTSLGDDTTNQATSPCGGYTPDLDDTTDVHTNGEAFTVQSSHPQSDWLFRATLDSTASKDWVEIHPIFQQSGIGTFCIPDVVIPSQFVGQKGIISVVGSGEDGMLYACVTAKFINGTGTAGDSCTTPTEVTLATTTNDDLSALLGTPDDSGSDSSDSGDDDSAAAGLTSLSMTGILGLAALVAGATLGL